MARDNNDNVSRNPDPLLIARDIVYSRLEKDIQDPMRRWQIAVACSNHLDMARVLRQPGEMLNE